MRIWSNLTLTTVQPKLELWPLYSGHTEAEIKWKRVGYNTGPGVTLVWWLENDQFSGGALSGSRPKDEQTKLTGLFPNAQYTVRIREDIDDYTVESFLKINTKNLTFLPILRNVSTTGVEIQMNFMPTNLNLFSHFIFAYRIGDAITGHGVLCQKYAKIWQKYAKIRQKYSKIWQKYAKKYGKNMEKYGKNMQKI